MKWNFLTKHFHYEANKSADMNLTEYTFGIAHLTHDASFTVTSHHVAGVRTSATVFTPTTSPVWTVDAEKDKVLVAFVNTDSSAYSVHKILSNIATACTIVSDGSYGDTALFASCDRVCIFDNWDDAQAAITYVAV